MKNRKLAEISNQILLALSQVEGDDPTTEEVRKHVKALANIWSGNVPAQHATLESQPTHRPSQHPTRRHDTPTETPSAKFPVVPPPVTRGQLVEDRPSTMAPSASIRPGTHTERRAVRKAAGFTLKQVAQMAHTTMPTARTYEIKRTAVRPDKRAALDIVYRQFRRPIDE